MYRYTVHYIHSPVSRRVYRVTVTARDADEARAKARIRDPLLVSTTKVKNLGAVESGRFDGLEEAKRREWIQDHGGYALVVDEGD